MNEPEQAVEHGSEESLSEKRTSNESSKESSGQARIATVSPKRTSIGMTSFERSMLIFTACSSMIAATGICISAFQWHEMHTGGVDTHKLAVASETQAAATKLQSDRTSSLVIQATEQAKASEQTAEATKDIADQTLAETKAANRLARESAHQAMIASETLRFSKYEATQGQRPWVGLQSINCGKCDLDQEGNIELSDFSATLINSGRTPAIDMVVNSIFVVTVRPDTISTYDKAVSDFEAKGEQAGQFASLSWQNSKEFNKSTMHPDLTTPLSVEVLAPGAQRPMLLAYPPSLQKGLRKSFTKPVAFELGKITYYDLSHSVQYVTSFCLTSETGTDVHYCVTGNTMQ